MNVRITRHVPGWTDGRQLAAGMVTDLPAGLALSLVNDGYAEVVREAPSEKRETATAKRPGRPRKES